MAGASSSSTPVYPSKLSLSMVRLEGEEHEAFKKFAPFVNKSNAEQFLEELNKAHFHLERNANTKNRFGMVIR